MGASPADDGGARRARPARFPLDDKRVYDAYVAGRQSAAMCVAVRAGLFDWLAADGAGASLEAVAARTGWSARGTRSMISALCAMGLVLRTKGGLRVSEDAAAYLTRGTPGSLWGLVDMEVDHFLSPRALMDALQKDDSSVYGDADPWEAHDEDPERARAFTAAMHSVSERPAAGVAEFVDLTGVKSLLDVGGGSGALSIALCGANPALRATIFDIAAVEPLAREYVGDAGLSDRIDVEVGDMFGPPLPAGHDAVLYSQILHDWGFEKGADLLARAFEALPPGGQVLVHEKLVEDEADAPLANALVHLDMLVWTEGQQYRLRELTGMLTAAGFEDVERVRTAGYWSLVSARRPR